MNNFLTEKEYAERCIDIAARCRNPLIIDFEMLKIKTGQENIKDFMICLKNCGAKNVSLELSPAKEFDCLHFVVQM